MAELILKTLDVPAEALERIEKRILKRASDRILAAAGSVELTPEESQAVRALLRRGDAWPPA